ncbi:MAG: 2,3-bisphosphoglycerate-independent phosphoglycerate mutase, partial [Planctomycetota bacterium]|nr:2,3-bisphosphoglycerate-independent phosphoglycerate mutase [Planctomycetota bacterium]
DGWAVEEGGRWNATTHARTPNHKRLFERFGASRLLCHGRYVGLPDGIMGNSEVGHSNIGAGRIVKQESLHIREKVENGEFFKNEVLLSVMRKCRESGGALHLMGLCSDGIVHSDIEHLRALLKMARQNRVSKVYLHLFLDGRDVAPKSALKYIRQVEEWCKEYGGKVATVGGRYWGMDRDKRWERTKIAYDAIVWGKGERFEESAEEALENAYRRGETDEFVKPVVIRNKEFVYKGMEKGDGVIFFNFRADRGRQLTRALVADNFNEFERKYDEKLKERMATFTLYDGALDVPYAFSLPPVEKNLGKVLSENGLKQFRIAETEKYAHVTYFFNNGREVPYDGEERLLIPSPKVATYDMKPEMSAYEVTDALLKRLDERVDDFVVVNYANCDMVGHTGVFEAAVKAVEVVDECVGRVVECVFRLGGVVVVTADHGNCEVMQDEEGSPHTYHTLNPVHFCIADSRGNRYKLRESGVLADVAPTVLDLLGLEKPDEMSGESMIEGG